jgi:hypothetical protein
MELVVEEQCVELKNIKYKTMLSEWEPNERDEILRKSVEVWTSSWRMKRLQIKTSRGAS